MIWHTSFCIISVLFVLFNAQQYFYTVVLLLFRKQKIYWSFFHHFSESYKWSADDRVWKKQTKYKNKRTVVGLTQGCLVHRCVRCWSVKRCVAVVFWSHVLLLFQFRRGSSPLCSPDSCLDSSSCLSGTLSSTRWAHVATRTNTNNTTPSPPHVQVLRCVFWVRTILTFSL